jgi:glycerol-3-phosphate dehydrogenase
MAKTTVDRLVDREGREAPCRTHEIPLGLPVDPADLPDAPGVDDASRAHLAARYGHAAREVMEMAAANPALAERISPDLPDLAAEAAFAARREQVGSLADVLLRRTRMGLLDARALSAPGSEGAVRAARAIAGELGWGEERVQSELTGWRTVAAAEGLVPRAEVEAVA